MKAFVFSNIMRNLRLGFDAKRLFCNKEGLGSYARTLLMDIQRLFPQHEYHLYTTGFDRDIDTEYFQDSSKYIVHTPTSGSFLWRYSRMTQDLLRDEIDVYIGLSNELPHGLSATRIKSIVVIHDLFYKYFPSQFKFLDRLIIQHKLQYALYHADKIVAVSKHTQGDIIKLSSSVKDKTTVIYQSVSKIFRDHNHPTDKGDYLLCVGSINDRKNIKLLVEAYMILAPEKRIPVIIAGQGRAYKEELKQMITDAGLESSFKFVGYVSNEALVGLYRGAIALVFPSKYEGFGIPVLEALSISVPVITSSSSSLPEIVGQHGIVIDYNDTSALANAIKHISNQKSRSEYIAGVEEHLQKFDHEFICNQYISNIERLLSNK